MADVPIRDAGKDAYIRHLNYAYPGHGKTSYIGTGAPEGLKVLLVRSPMDSVPLRVLGSGTKEWVVRDWEEQFQVLEYCQYHGSEWDWIWWDCMSVAQDVLLDDLWEKVIAEKPHRNSLTPAGGLDRGEYGRNMERISRWVRHMVGCNSFHFGITAHPYEGPHPTNDEGGVLLQPWVQGKNMVSKICGYMNTVTFMEVKENDKGVNWRRMYFRENERFYAKDQQDGFKEKGYVDNPTLAQVTAALVGGTKSKGRSTSRGRRTTATTTARPTVTRRRRRS